MDERRIYQADTREFLRLEADRLYGENVYALRYYQNALGHHGYRAQSLQLVPQDYVGPYGEVADVPDVLKIAEEVMSRLYTTYSVGPIVFKEGPEGARAYWRLVLGGHECYVTETRRPLRRDALTLRGVEELPMQAEVSNRKPHDYDEILRRALQQLERDKNNSPPQPSSLDSPTEVPLQEQIRASRIRRAGKWIGRCFGKRPPV